MAASFKDYVRYAWHGSGRRWDAVWMAVLGGLIGGFAIWMSGLKMPQTILDNPLWGGVVAIVLGAITGVIVVFAVRLCWAPIHFAFKSRGGLRVFGHQMWPLILMASGVLAFVLLFGGGAIWFIAQSYSKERPAPASTLAVPNLPAGAVTQSPQPVILASEVHGHIKALDKLYAALEQSGEALFQKTQTLSFPWQRQFPWNLRKSGRFGPAPPPLTVENAKAAVPEIQQLETLRRQMVVEIYAATSEYPYVQYSRSVLGTGWDMPDFNATSLIMSINNLQDGVDQKYMNLLLVQNTQSLIESLQRFRDWFTKTKNAIAAKRKEEEASLQHAYAN